MKGNFRVKLKNWWKNSGFYRYIGSAIAHPKNYFFCKKYPFWKLTDPESNKFLGYKHTWYEKIPVGWQLAFGNQLSEDLVKVLKKYSKRRWSKLLSWMEIKERKGALYFCGGLIKQVNDVLDKYELISRGYCVRCGKPARYITRAGHSHYYCERCFKADFVKKAKKPHSKLELKEAMQSSRLTQEDIPHSVLLDENGKAKSRDLKINFKTLWNLK